METKNNLQALALSACIGLASHNVYAENIIMNTAQMQALDKITGQMSVIEVPVGGEVSFGSFSVIARSCQTNPPEDIPENYAFIDIADTNREGKTFNIFKGWMVSSSPSLNSVEHPIYDVWLLKCLNTADAEKKQLTPQQLAERDKLEKMQEDDLSKEAKIAQELQKEQAKRDAEEKAQQQEQQRLDDENKERQEALNKELQIQQQETDTQSLQAVSGDDGEGPVSLLNMGQNLSQQTLEKAASPEIQEQTTETHTNEPNSTVTAVEVVEETVSHNNENDIIVIEDTHHETIDHDWELPNDIDEILPTNQE